MSFARGIGFVMVAVWDGFLMMGEGLGLQPKAAQRFADIAWQLLAVLVGLWLAAVVLAVR